MASSARTLLNAVKPHVPSIKFRYGKGICAPTLTQGIDTLLQSTVSSQPAAPTGKAIGSTARGSGIDYRDLPQRYHRKPLSDEEMEFIQRGGPV